MGQLETMNSALQYRYEPNSYMQVHNSLMARQGLKMFFILNLSVKLVQTKQLYIDFTLVNMHISRFCFRNIHIFDHIILLRMSYNIWYMYCLLY